MKFQSIMATVIAGVAVLMMTGAANVTLKGLMGQAGKNNSLNSYYRVAGVAGPYLAVNFYAEK